MTSRLPPLPPSRLGRYQLQPVRAAQWPLALQALRQGYPQVPAAWWEAGFRRWQQVPPNDADRPLGMLLRGPTGVAGVGLLFDSDGRLPGLARRQVNASSWTVADGHRGRALWMARESLAEPATAYNALTAVPAVERILQALGFQPLFHQRVLVVTARAAVGAAPGVQVLDAAATLAALRHSPLARALHDHQRLGCLVMGLAGTGVGSAEGVAPLVLRRRRRAGLPWGAEVLYAPSVPQLARAIGPLSRHLLARGIVLLEFDACQDTHLTLPCTRLFRRRFGRGPATGGAIDWLYSELVYLGNG